MADSDNEIVGLMVQQSEDEARDNPGAKKGGRYVQSAFPGGPAKKVPGAMFGPRRFRENDNLSTKPAPGPKGPPTAQLLEDAKRRRRERAEQERNCGR